MRIVKTGIKLSNVEKNFLTALAIMRSYNPKTDKGGLVEHAFKKLTRAALSAMKKYKLIEYVKCKNRSRGGYYRMYSREDWNIILK